MKNQENAKYIKLACAGIAVVAVSLLMFFALFRTAVIVDFIRSILKILKPFIYGGVIAYLLCPVCNWFQDGLTKLLRGRKPKLAAGLAIVLSLLMALLLVWLLVMLVVPQVGSSVSTLVVTLPGKVQSTINNFHDSLADKPEIQKYWDSISNQIYQNVTEAMSQEKIDSFIQEKLMPTAQNLLGSVGSGVLSVAQGVKDFIIGIIISVYFLAERKKFAAQARLVVYGVLKKEWADMVLEEVNYADMMFNGFISGKILDSTIIGVLCFISLKLLHFPSAALISVIIGVTNIIPFFGPFIGAIPCALLLLLEDPLYCLYFIIFVLVLQQVDGNIIGPKILGDTTGLSSFWVLFAILLFGGKWGIVGMVVGVPLWAVIYDIFRRLISANLVRRQEEELLEEYRHDFGAVPAEEKPKPEARSREAKKKMKVKK